MRYYYSKLGENEKKVYKEIYYALENHKNSVTVSLPGGYERVSKICRYVMLDNPMIFYVNQYARSITTLGFKYIITFKYLYSKKEIAVMKEQIEEKLAELEKKILSYNSKIERERFIHRYIMSNMDYDYNTNIQEDMTCHNIVGALLKKRAVCDGISFLFKALCDIAKINSLVIVGDGWNQYDPPQPHAWNMVKIDGNWYHIDMTWDLNLSKRFKYVRYDYFNIRYDEIKRDHANFDILEKCDSLSNNYFYETNCIVRGVNELDDFLVKKFKEIRKSPKKVNFISIKFYNNTSEKSINLIFNSMSKAISKSFCYNIKYTVSPNDTQDVYLLEITKMM